jgi:zinc-ribbon domain
MKFCPTCGAQLREGARFCENCGTALATQSPPASTSVPAPAPLPVAEPTVVATGPVPVPPAPAQQKNRKRLLTGLGGVAAVGVLGVVGYVVYDQLSGPSGGAASPEAAVLELSAAAAGEDAVTALSLLPPGEVGPIVDLYREVEAKAISTGVTAQDHPFAGFDLRIDGVAVRVEELGEGVAAVTITSGTVSWTVDPGQMQGPLRIEHDGDVRDGAEGSADLVEVSSRATDGAPLRIMTVQQDGRWFVSPSYTLLEAWRVGQGLPAPDFSRELDLEGTGADSAEAAVREAALAAAAYDVDGLLDLLSPEEAAALYHYRDAITMALHRDGALAELQDEGQLEIVSLVATEGEDVGGRVPVTVQSASGGLYDDDGDYTSWTLDGNCVSWNDRGRTDGGCLDEVFDEMNLSGTDLVTRFDALTLLTQEVDGRWYLAPLATLVSEARDAVAGLDADALASMLGVPQFGGVDGTLVEGETVDGSIDNRRLPALYEIDVPAGRVFSTCIDGDVHAYLYGPDGRPTGHGAVLATDDGRYRVVVAGAEDGTSFSLRPVLSSVEEITVPGTAAPADGDACGSRLVGFEATAGQPLLFGAEGASEVQVRTPSGETVWGTAFVPEETGMHFIAVSAAYPVRIDVVGDDVLTAGNRVTVTVGDTGQTSLRVFAQAGRDVEIEVSGTGTARPYARLYTLDGSFVDGDSGSSFDPARVYPYNDSGVYELRIEDLDGTGGTYQVSITEN